MRQIEQEARLRGVEEAPQPHRFRQLAGPHVEEAGDVLHHERLIEPRPQGVGVADEALQEILAVERRKDVVQVVRSVHRVEALEVLSDPRCAIQLGDRDVYIEYALVVRIAYVTELCDM